MYFIYIKVRFTVESVNFFVIKEVKKKKKKEKKEW